MPTHHLSIPNKEKDEEPEAICLFAQTNFRNEMRRFGIKTDDRRRHMYVIGKTGMGKTTLLENMVLQDIYNGHGIGVVDPHGDFAEKIIDYIPADRINDVIYFNPADTDYPIGFNILEVDNDEQKHLIAANLMAVFKKIWPDVWSSRMEYILNNTLLALLDYEGSTLLGINRLLADKKFRRKVLRKLTDPVIKAFWNNEFANYEPRYQKEAVAPIQNKIGQFLSASVIRNMVAQVKSSINVREAMDTNKILIMNLSKGRLGEDNSRLLGGMLITAIQIAAMSRVDTPEKDRQDFFLYVDEFQNFATPSFANILSEARKYRLSLVMAHQYVAQLDEVVADAVFGNVGSMVAFRVGAGDAEALEKEFAPTFTVEDIVNLPKFQIFLKLMIDGVSSQPFSAASMPPIGSATGSFDKVVRVSRERYAKKKDVIEEKISRWSGADEDDEAPNEASKKNQSSKSSSAPTKRIYADKKSRQESTSQRRSDVSTSTNTRRPAATDKPIRKTSPARPPNQSTTRVSELQNSTEEKASSIARSSDKKKSVGAEAVGEPTVTLSDLLPKGGEKKEIELDTSADVMDKEPASTIKHAKQKEQGQKYSSTHSKKSEGNEIKSTHTERTSGASTQEAGEKKKRNRRRKTHAPQRVERSKKSKDIKNTLQKKPAQQKKQAPTIQSDTETPKPLKQDEVVSFDTTKDNDDSW